MVKDAEIHRNEDKKFHELVNARNEAEALIHQTTKQMEEGGAQFSSEQRGSLDQALAELGKAVKTDDIQSIEKKKESLQEILLQVQQTASHAPEESSSSPNEDVVDAEFTDVSDSR